MANQIFSCLFPKTLTLTSFLYRSLFITTTTTLPSSSATSFLLRFCLLSAFVVTSGRVLLPNSSHSFSTRATTSSLKDPNPNWSNRRILKETTWFHGIDFEHWRVVIEKPEGNRNPTRDEIIDGFIKTLAQVFRGNEEEARMKIYSVNTTYYYAFGVLCSEELSYKCEPFINGQAAPYHPKYHEKWFRPIRPSNNVRHYADMFRVLCGKSGYGPNGGMPDNMGEVPESQNMGGFPPNAGWGNNQ